MEEILRYYFKDSPVDFDKLLKDPSIGDFVNKTIVPDSDKDPVLKEMLINCKIIQLPVTAPITTQITTSVSKQSSSKGKGWYKNYMKSLITEKNEKCDYLKNNSNKKQKLEKIEDTHNLTKF